MPVKKALVNAKNENSLKSYETIVNKIKSNSVMLFKDSVSIGKPLTKQKDETTELDQSSRYMIAAGVAELFHNRLDRFVIV